MNRRFLPSLIVLVISLTALIFIWRDLDVRHAHNLRDHFQAETVRITAKINLRTDAYAQILRGAAGLFAASDEVSRTEWRRYIEKLELDQTFRGIQGVGFSQFVQPDQLDGHLRTIRAQGFPDYIVKPEGQRDAYTSIIYLEPFSGRNLRAFGYDMYSEPIRQAAMDAARDNAAVAFSGKVKLVQETKTDVQAGILAYHPVYANQTLPQTVEQRRKALIGWTYSPYRMDDMMEGMVRDDLGTIRLEIFDGDTLQPEALLYDSEPKGGLDESPSTLTVVSKTELSGRTWTLRYRALPGFAATTKFEPPWVEFSAISLISVLLFGLTWTLANTQHRAQNIAAELTASLQESESRFRATFEQAAVGVVHVDPTTGHFLRVNNRFCEWLGSNRSELEHLSFRDVTHPEDRGLGADQLPAVAEHRIGSFRLEKRYQCKDGTVVWGNLTVSAVHATDGAAAYLIAVVEDINERKRVEALLRESQSHLQTIIENEPECIKIVDTQGRLVLMNPAGLTMIEADSLEQVRGCKVADLIAPEQRVAFEDMHAKVIGGTAAELEFEVIGLKGGRRWLETHAVPMQDHGQTVHLAVTRDITRRKEMEDKVRQLAFHDVLTQLPNRRLLLDRLSQAMVASERNGRFAAVLFLDLDNFKPLNDAHGHEMGDLLLIEVGQRLRSCVREIDTVSRFGGDEFVVMLSDLDNDRAESVAQARAVAEKIRQFVAKPYRLAIQQGTVEDGTVTHHCSASIGVAVFQDHEGTEEEVIAWADKAMYKAKEAGRNQICVDDSRSTMASAAQKSDSFMLQS